MDFVTYYNTELQPDRYQKFLTSARAKAAEFRDTGKSPEWIVDWLSRNCQKWRDHVEQIATPEQRTQHSGYLLFEGIKKQQEYTAKAGVIEILGYDPFPPDPFDRSIVVPEQNVTKNQPWSQLNKPLSTASITLGVVMAYLCFLVFFVASGAPDRDGGTVCLFILLFVVPLIACIVVIINVVHKNEKKYQAEILLQDRRVEEWYQKEKPLLDNTYTDPMDRYISE